MTDRKDKRELHISELPPKSLPSSEAKGRLEILQTNLIRIERKGNRHHGELTSAEYFFKDWLTAQIKLESEIREVRTITPEEYRSPYKKFDPKQHKNYMTYNRETDSYEVKKPSNFRY